MVEKEKTAEQKLMNWLNTKKITPAQLIMVLIGIIIFVMFETAIFDNWGDSVKVVIYVSIVGVSILLGFQVVDVKKFAVKLKDIVLDPKLTLWEKITALTNLAVPILAEMGQTFELLNIQQFEAKPIIDKK